MPWPISGSRRNAGSRDGGRLPTKIIALDDSVGTVAGPSATKMTVIVR